MMITRKIEDYADIINMPRPEPQVFMRMPMQKRAAQFAPFAALVGYDTIVDKTAQQHEDDIKQWERGSDDDEFGFDDSQ